MAAPSRTRLGRVAPTRSHFPRPPRRGVCKVKRPLSHLLAATTALLPIAMTVLVATPAHAQFGGIVYDPTNYSQNILTAARTLEQINNQIRQLQNQATSLVNEARNLTTLPLNILQPLQQQIQQTQTLLRQAQRMAYDVQQIETQFGAQYKNIDLTASQRAMVTGAEDRWKTSVAAFEDALKVQAGAVANIDGARGAVTSLVTASQSATGALQAAQAGNQLLASQSQQLADLTAVVAAQGRAQALDSASAAAAKAQAREQLRRFLAPGRGYVPASAQMFRN
ncbi:MAG: P-type conjugative transfer protein TrbJ [Sphingomonadales bacterium]|nr:P-type conjugative transfer protein TrbJ [Sphingomonadales bacterium]